MASALKNKLKLPGETGKAPRSSGKLANVKKGDVLRKITHSQLKQLLDKDKFPALLDFGPAHFQLEDDQFLSTCQNIVKELHLTSNSLVELLSIEHLNKLKLLCADKNQLNKISLRGLTSLEYLDLSQNRLEILPPLSDLKKLVNVNLAGNRIGRGFEELAHLKSLQVLDLGRNSLDMTIQQFNKFVLGPLRKLPKLTYLSFAENPICVKCVKFKLFVISELPRLKYLDWKPITKEERQQASKLQQNNKWKDKDLPAAPLSSSSSSPQSDSPKTPTEGKRLSTLLSTDDSALVNFLLLDDDDGDDPLDSILADLETRGGSSPSASSLAKGTADETPSSDPLDDFLNGGDADDPLTDIIDFLETGDADAKDAGKAPGGEAGEPYGDELMRIIYGDGAHEGAPGDDDGGLDDLLDSMFDQDPGPGGAPSDLDALLAEEEAANRQRKQEDGDRLARERERLEAKKQRELEAEKAGLRAEMESQKQRELEEERAQNQAMLAEERAKIKAERAELEKQKMELSPEDEALAMLDGIMGESGNDSDADAVLAMIDQAVGGARPVASTSGAPKKRFGPRSSPARRFSGNPLASRQSSARIQAAVEDDDPLAELLAAQSSGPTSSALPKWITKWSQLKLGERLGVGTFGSTYRAWLKGNEITVKKLKIQRFADAFLQKASAEVPKLLKIRHENLVPFLGWCQDDTLCTLQGYVRGTVLWGYLRNHANTVDLQFIVKAARGIASGLKMLHSVGIIHRNLHSKNVLLNAQMNVKLRDYGLAYLKQETYDIGAGPIRYEAPELLTKGAFTSAVDVYAFGVVMWEMWTRATPYGSMMPPIIKQKVLAGQRPEIMPDISAVFQKLIKASWNADATRRPNIAVISKILSKDISELGTYGGVSGAPAAEQATPQGRSSGAPASSAPAAQDLEASSVVVTMAKLTAKINPMLKSPERANVERGLRVVINLVDKPEYSKHTSALRDLVANIVPSLRPGTNRTTQDLSMQALAKICDNEPCSEEFRQSNGFPALLHLVGSPELPLRISASKLLLALISKSQNVRDNLSFLGAIPCLVQMLNTDNQMLQTNAVWALSLALENPLNQDEFLRCGGVAPLLSHVQSTNPGIVLRVLVGVGYLITNAEVFHKLKDSGVIQRFINLLNSPTELLQRHAIEAIHRFSQHSELRDIIYRSNGLTEVIALLHNESAAVRIHAVETLANYSGDAEHAEYVRDLSALKPVVRMMVAKDAALRLAAVGCMSEAANQPALVEQLRQFGALQPLVQLLNAKDEQIQSRALRALAVLSRDADNHDILAAAGAVTQVVRVLSASGSGDAKDLGAEVLGNLASDPAGAQAFRRAKAIPLLVSVLKEGRSSAATALVSCCTTPEGREQILQEGGLVPLMKMLKHPDENISDRVLWSIPHFANDETTAGMVVKTVLADVIEMLPTCKESLQSIGLKTILVLCQRPEYHDSLREFGAVRALQHLGDSSLNATISMASEKAIAILTQ